METDLTPDHLIRRLDAVFASVPYPGDDHLLAHDCPASRSLCDDLHGLPPSRVPEHLIARHYDGMSFLSPAARRYYLPAYARTALRLPESSVAEFLLYALAGDLGWQLERELHPAAARGSSGLPRIPAALPGPPFLAADRRRGGAVEDHRAAGPRRLTHNWLINRNTASSKPGRPSWPKSG